MPSQTFPAQAGWQKFPIPKGVDRVTVDLKGAGSGASNGGRVRGQIKVKDTDVLFLQVGEQGKAPTGRQGGPGSVGGGGGGGDGSTGRDGGRGGGGAAAIRLNSYDGTIKAVAGGAGGHSGDSGAGGDGGGSTGQHGSLSSGLGTVGNATGGTQIQGGNGGASTPNPRLNGDDAPNRGLARGGRGGQWTSQNTHGGGGGGGGYRAGGGGAAALITVSAGGGGGGGSNFTGGLFTGVSSEQGGGGTGDGSIVITWQGPPPANQQPGSPSDAKINGKSESPGLGTRSTGRVTISAIVRDPDATTVPPVHTGDPATQKHQKARLVVRYSPNKNFSHVSTERSDLVEYGKRATVTLTGLAQNTHYFARLYAEDSQGKRSPNYNGVDFWTNRDPTEPKLQSPGDNGVVLDTDTTTFDWAHQDPDPGDDQSAFTIRWRRAQSATDPAGTWVPHEITGTSFDNYAADPGVFKAGRYYDWTVRTRDQQKAWGPFAIPRSFYVLGSVIPPTLLAPIKAHGVDASEPVVLSWKFHDPVGGVAQIKADYRFRVIGTDDWVTVIGDTTIPGSDKTWEVPEDTFAVGYEYEWAMRTTSSSGLSDWSDSEKFWAHAGVGSLAEPVIDDDTFDQGALGCGQHRVFIYDRGGRVLRGEITPLVNVQWTRSRDDIGGATVTTNGFGDDCGELLANLHTWIHELVIYRDTGAGLVRVMEGPVTLIEDSVDGFKIEIKDVMGYVYRRIMRQGYNDSYHVVNGVVEGILTVVERAGLILSDALARRDPNVLPYVTQLSYPDDARESRVVPDFGKTAWEEIDDMAANAGLDYSVIGRRIILNDTHRPVGRLPEFRPEYFNQAPKITEYGMLLSDYYAVTNNSGLWSAVEHKNSPYGGVEILVSAFSENAAGSGEVMTKAKQEAVREVLLKQAKRGIASRYPAPYVVRVPDNSQLTPEVPVGINQLVPGVWIPLRAKGTVVEISQWQKLDQVQVTETGGTETVCVTMSPAPNAGQDPDAAESAATAEEADS